MLDKQLNVHTKKDRQIKLREILINQIKSKSNNCLNERDEEKKFRNIIIKLNEEI